jgi:2-polyprenyl-3-methyl-5-hydroxy-6-metoxy-1,4-benzoquinol methylase
MTAYDQDFWEQRWAQALSRHGDRVAQRPPNPHLVGELAELRPGRALDAGCGHGSDTLWLAARGWRVTALDFAATALDFARTTAEAMDLADRVEWVEADLGTWVPERAAYDLVVCLYVHIDGPPEAFVRRMASGVAPHGTLFLVGHQNIDQQQVSTAAAVAALSPDEWDVLVAEDRPRATGTGVDAVVRARRAGVA